MQFDEIIVRVICYEYTHCSAIASPSYASDDQALTFHLHPRAKIHLHAHCMNSTEETIPAVAVSQDLPIPVVVNDIAITEFPIPEGPDDDGSRAFATDSKILQSLWSTHVRASSAWLCGGISEPPASSHAKVNSEVLNVHTNGVFHGFRPGIARFQGAEERPSRDKTSPPSQ